MRLALPLFCLALAGCVETTQTGATSGAVTQATPKLSSATTLRNFRIVQARVEPVAERECRARTANVNCDFLIQIDERRGQPSNAYQSLDRDGRPVITFTIKLIEDTLNQDEIAFVMGHEAAHHIEDHIRKTVESATIGAVLGSLVGALVIGNEAAADVGQQLGGTVGARAFSKEMELEADALGTIITHKAGYDPRRGAEFFFRIPDPGDKFLGTHPPNEERRVTVQRVAANL